MDERDIEAALSDLAELKNAVKRNQPLLRELASPRGFAPLALGFGVLLVAFSLSAHFLVAAHGSFEAVPAAWRAALWGFLGAIIAIGGVTKVVVVLGRSREIDASLTAREIMRHWFSSILHTVVPMAIVSVATIAFCVSIGRPWYVASVLPIAFGFVINALAREVGFKPYHVIGYWSIVLGCVSAFSIEAAPFVWIAVIYGGMFLVFAATELLSRPRARG